AVAHARSAGRTAATAPCPRSTRRRPPRARRSPRRAMCGAPVQPTPSVSLLWWKPGLWRKPGPGASEPRSEIAESAADVEGLRGDGGGHLGGEVADEPGDLLRCG